MEPGDSTRTRRELDYLCDLTDRQRALRDLLAAAPELTPESSLERWHAYFASIKQTTGNINNDSSFVATLWAKQYLLDHLQIVPFDAAEKAQGAPGLDIDATTQAGERVVAEVKTTVPYKDTDFGAAQLTALRRDFAKLLDARARHRFLFLTDPSAWQCVTSKHASEVPGVSVVCLTTGDRRDA